MAEGFYPQEKCEGFSTEGFSPADLSSEDFSSGYIVVILQKQGEGFPPQTAKLALGFLHR